MNKSISPLEDRLKENKEIDSTESKISQKKIEEESDRKMLKSLPTKDNEVEELKQINALLEKKLVQMNKAGSLRSIPETNMAPAIVGAAIAAAADLVKWGVDTILAATKVQCATLSDQATNDVNQMKNEYGNGVSTLIIVHNETEHYLDYTNDRDWSGHIWKYPYPVKLGPGQTGCFLHVHTSGSACGSEACLILRIRDNCDVFLGWNSPFSGTNTAYTEIREFDHWPYVGSWSYMHWRLDKGASSVAQDTRGNFKSSIALGQASSPLMVMTVEQLKSTEKPTP